jgi:hypothetical protein
MPEETENLTAPHQGFDHRAEAMVLLGDHRPPAGTIEALAAAQVHATLAMAESQHHMTQLLSMGTRELNAANLFRLAATLTDDHPLRTIIHNGLLNHMTKHGALHTDVTLATRIKELGLEVKAGDDIAVGTGDGREYRCFLVIDPDNDEWLLLSDMDSMDSLENPEQVDSPKIHAMFGDDISTLMITIRDTPKP